VHYEKGVVGQHVEELQQLLSIGGLGSLGSGCYFPERRGIARSLVGPVTVTVRPELSADT